jgi:vanillate O-demethylase monooxygenase subunit
MIPQTARVKYYPVVERYRWLWIWMGDPAQADAATIPDYHWFDDPAWGAKSDYLYAQCNWQLVNDNQLDLTHLAFVHETTIGNMALVEHAAVKVERTPAGVRVTRWIIDQPAPPAFVRIGGFTGNVDRWQIIDYTPPSFIRLDVGATPTGTGAPQGKRVGGISMRNLNAMTPETETTTHYFWGQAHDFEPRNQDMTEKVFGQIKTAFLEDVAVFTAQQKNIELDPAAPTIDINADSGGIQARRIVARLYAEEQAAMTAAKTAAE